MKTDQGLWDKVWMKQATSSPEHRKAIEEEIKSVRWRKIEKELLNAGRAFEGLKVIELGSGRGIVSLLMGLKGAEVTLLDSSEVALGRAGLLFKDFGCDARFRNADIFDLPGDILGQFDIAMSFGLVEHFRGEERQQAMNAHYSVLRSRGTCFISVPNRFCLPYRFWKKSLELRRRWAYGFEDPFTRRELMKKAQAANFTSCTIIGSSFLNAIDRFFLFSALSRIGINTEVSSFLDYYFGYALVLVGHRL